MRTIFLLSATAAVFATAGAASESSDIASHKSSVATALADLGVSRLVALECMASMPDHVWLGSTLTKEQGAADKKAMYDCVKKHNPDLSEEKFDEAVSLFR
ncbi:hypothetical protein [Chachezhania antarctica]|uniref:hypothetical protein n=1 Tax=Chachezhania antarctica TaxID=2340860 RepID=UPI000EB452EA|nr:hypothetical protein [Chachezhania antarctica]